MLWFLSMLCLTCGIAIGISHQPQRWKLWLVLACAIVALLLIKPAHADESEPFVLLSLPKTGGVTIEIAGQLSGELVDSVNLVVNKRGSWYITRNGKLWGTVPAGDFTIKIDRRYIDGK